MFSKPSHHTGIKKQKAKKIQIDYLSIVDVMDVIDLEYNIVGEKNVPLWKPRHENTALFPSMMGAVDSTSKTSIYLLQDFDVF